jgi:hypothetical protein
MLRITMDMPESITSVHDALDPDPDTLLAVVRVCTCRLRGVVAAMSGSRIGLVVVLSVARGG